MRRTLALASVPAFVLALAACGGDDGETSSGSGSGSGSGTETTESTESTGTTGSSEPAEGGESTVTVEALDSLEFDSDSYTATAGEITFVYENDGSLPHTLLVEGVDADEFKLEVGDTDEGTVELEAGEYTLYCDVPGHQSAGMEASLTVE